MNPRRTITLVSVLCTSSIAIAQPISENREWTETYAMTTEVARLEISNIWADVKVSNVNGPIHINGAQHCNSLSNINGVVDLSFEKSPGNDCDIETVDAYSMPAQIDHIEQDGLNRYRIRQAAGLRIAGGGNTFTISSLNGDIRIQKSK